MPVSNAAYCTVLVWMTLILSQWHFKTTKTTLAYSKLNTLTSWTAIAAPQHCTAFCQHTVQMWSLTFIRSRGWQIAALFEKRRASLIWDLLWAAGVVVFCSYTMSRQMAAHPAHCAMLLCLSLFLKYTVSGRAADCRLASACGIVDHASG
jgi:hypothetical protein